MPGAEDVCLAAVRGTRSGSDLRASLSRFAKVATEAGDAALHDAIARSTTGRVQARQDFDDPSPDVSRE